MHAARRPRDASATLGLLLFVELWWIFMFIFFSCDMKLNGGLLLWGLAGSRSSRGSSHYSVDDRPEPSLGLPGKISIFCIQCAVSDFHWKIMIDCSVYLLMVVLCSSCRCIIAESWMNWINRPWVSGLFVIAKCVDIQVILLLERCFFIGVMIHLLKIIEVVASNLILLQPMWTSWLCWQMWLRYVDIICKYNVQL